MFKKKKGVTGNEPLNQIWMTHDPQPSIASGTCCPSQWNPRVPGRGVWAQAGMRIIYSSLTPIHWIPCLTPLFLRGYPRCKLTITCRSPLVHSQFAPATGTANAAWQYSLLLVSTDRKENWWQMMKYVSCVSPPLSPQCSDLPSAERSYASADFTVAKANIYIYI